MRASCLHMICERTNSKILLLHPDISLARIQKYERDVSALLNLITNDWINPFHDRDIVSLSSAAVPTPEIVKDLVKAHKVGEEAYETFKREYLSQDSKLKVF